MLDSFVDMIGKGDNESIESKTLHSPFSIETHKEVFTNYLEVIIDEEGTVHYAVPSHQEYLINKAIEILDITRDELFEQFEVKAVQTGVDVITYLCDITKCVSVWDNGYVGDLNNKQYDTLSELKRESLYRGNIVSPTSTVLTTTIAQDSGFEENAHYIGSHLYTPKQIAEVSLCGCLKFCINDDNTTFVRPTPEQIKNLRENFCIDVKLFDDDEKGSE